MSFKTDVASGNPWRDSRGRFNDSPFDFLKNRGGKTYVSREENEKKIKSFAKEAKADLERVRSLQEVNAGKGKITELDSADRQDAISDAMEAASSDWSKTTLADVRRAVDDKYPGNDFTDEELAEVFELITDRRLVLPDDDGGSESTDPKAPKSSNFVISDEHTDSLAANSKELEEAIDVYDYMPGEASKAELERLRKKNADIYRAIFEENGISDEEYQKVKAAQHLWSGGTGGRNADGTFISDPELVGVDESEAAKLHQAITAQALGKITGSDTIQLWRGQRAEYSDPQGLTSYTNSQFIAKEFSRGADPKTVTVPNSDIKYHYLLDFLSNHPGEREIIADGGLSNKDKAKNAVIAHSEAILGGLSDTHAQVHLNEVEAAQNALGQLERDNILLQQARLEDAVKNVDKQVYDAVINQLLQGNVKDAEELITQAQEDSYVEALYAALLAYGIVAVGTYANALLQMRLTELGYQVFFSMPEKSDMDWMEGDARKAAKSHIQTIEADLSNSILKAYENEIKRRADINIADGLDTEAAYKLARTQARKGESLNTIINTIQTEYPQVNDRRAKVIARNESMRTFAMGQYEADKQFLKQTGNTKNAYKKLVSSTGHPCPICKVIINRTRKNPIPFTKNFANLHEEITAEYVNAKGETKTAKMKMNYEAIKAGVVHVQCNCQYELMIKRDDGSFLNLATDKVTAKDLTFDTNKSIMSEE